jgi:hypothetical protein
MGLQNRERATYLTLNADGKFAQSFKTQVEGSIGRINKEKRQVYELFFQELVGKITNVVLEDSSYGLQWKVTLMDDTERFIVTMGFSSNYAKGFLKMFENINLEKPVTLSPAVSTDARGESSTSLFIYQDGKLVPYAYKSDAPNGMPERELITVGGKEKWDYTKQLKWLGEKVAKHLGNATMNVVEKEVTLDDIANTKESEEIPF